MTPTDGELLRAWARRAYLLGEIDAEEFERLIGMSLHPRPLHAVPPDERPNPLGNSTDAPLAVVRVAYAGRMAAWTQDHGDLYGPVQAKVYRCGWCHTGVSSVLGFDNQNIRTFIRFCPACERPTTVDLRNGTSTPSMPYGEEVTDVPPDLAALYEEARTCVGSANHAAVLVARKMLMHVAVDKGADPGKTFAFYIDYLVKQNLIPPGTKDWVDEIREFGNEANHEIKTFAVDDARIAIDFVSMLLRLVYEFPARGQRSIEARSRD